MLFTENCALVYVAIDLDPNANGILSSHFVELELGRQVHFHLKCRPSYGFNVVGPRTTIFSFSCVRVIVKVQSLTLRDNLGGNALKMIHGRYLEWEKEGGNAKDGREEAGNTQWLNINEGKLSEPGYQNALKIAESRDYGIPL